MDVGENLDTGWRKVPGKSNWHYVRELDERPRVERSKFRGTPAEEGGR